MLVGVGVVDHVVRPRDDRDEVGRQRLGGGEVVHRRPGGTLRGLVGRVGDHHPLGRGGDDERDAGLEVGLVEAREDALGVGGLELGVEVHLVVDGVDHAVQALARGGVAAVRVQLEDVVRGEVGELEPVGLVERRDVEGPAVEHGGPDRRAAQVHERGRPRRPAGEAHGGGRAEGALAGAPGAVGEIQRHVVRVDVQEAGARGGLVPRQIDGAHRRALPSRPVGRARSPHRPCLHRTGWRGRPRGRTMGPVRFPRAPPGARPATPLPTR